MTEICAFERVRISSYSAPERKTMSNTIANIETGNESCVGCQTPITDDNCSTVETATGKPWCDDCATCTHKVKLSDPCAECNAEWSGR